MSVRLENYRCEICGNIVDIRNPGGGSLVCCGQAMKLLKENSVDAAQEKHVPVIEKIPGGYKVSVGAVAHPMEDKHFIQWIELFGEGFSLVKYLKPGEAPVAEFQTAAAAVSAREYCNLHGLWRKD